MENPVAEQYRGTHYPSVHGAALAASVTTNAPLKSAAICSTASLTAAIAKQYGVAIAGLSRHVAEHIQGPLRRIIQAEASLTEDAQTVQPTLLEMRRLNQRSLRILAIAEESQDHDVALRAIAECRRHLELISKLTGELDPHAASEGGGQGLVVNVRR